MNGLRVLQNSLRRSLNESVSRRTLD